MPPNVHCSTIYNSQDMEAIYMSINRGMDKEDVVLIYKGILLSHKRNEIVPFVETWMDLETVIQSEVSQKEKNKYLLYMESRKMLQMNLFAKQE